MTTIYFVRHAEPDHSCDDDRSRPLTAEGQSDARSLVEFFRDKNIDAFASSPYARSYGTVQPAAESLGLAIETDERLRERKGGKVSNRHDMFRKRWADKNWAEEGGECLASVQKRNVAALRDLLDRHAGKTIAVGTHGTALSCIMNHFDPAFGCDDFLRIINFMPYVVRMVFDGNELVGKTEELIVEKVYPVSELWDLLDADRKPVGRTHARDVPVPPGFYHLVVEIWVVDSAGNILVTRRHPDKPYGLYWEGTGGSALAGETSREAALRELREETGIDASGCEGGLVRQYSGRDTHYDVWLFRKDPSPGEIRLQAEEVVDFKWVTRGEFEAMLERGELIPKLSYLLGLL